MKKILIVTLLFFASCYKEKDYSNTVSNDAFSLNPINVPSILADNFSTVKITVSLPLDADESLTQVTFKTTEGTFVETGEKSAAVKAKRSSGQKERTAEINLKSSLKVETAHVSVDLFDVKKTIEINFVKALPERIKIVPSSLSIKPSNSSANGGEITIEVNATRSQGNPSTGNIIEIKSVDSLFKNNLGSFRVQNSSLDINSKASFTYALGDSILNRMNTAYVGPLYIIASVQGANPPISDTVKIISSR